MSKMKEEQFFRDAQDKLNRGRDIAEEFSKNMKEKGFLGAVGSIFNTSNK